MADDEQQAAPQRTKPKRVVSQATLDMLAAGRAKRDANRKAAAAEKVTHNGQDLVLVDREQVRQDRESRLAPQVGDAGQDDEHEAGGDDEDRDSRVEVDTDREAGRPGERDEDRESRAAELEDREAGPHATGRSREREQDRESRPRDDGQERARPRSIDDVVNKLRARAGDEPIESEYPSVEEVARRTETYGAGAAVPSTERDPAKRDKPTMGRVDMTDAAPPDLSTAKIRGLGDLMSMFPVGDGQYEVQVVRRAPASWGGFQCKGQQRPIREYMTDAGFVDAYGGGEYLLTVFGPPRRGGIVDPKTRRVRPKALTDAVPYAVPQTYPPNPDACVFEDHDPDDEDEDNDMRYAAGFEPTRSSRPNTNADAKMLEVQVGADERKADREREREREIARQAREHERELAERVSQAQRAQEPLYNGAISAVQAANERASEMMEKQLLAAEARADREREAAERRAQEQIRPDPSNELAARTMDRLVDMVTKRSPEQGAELARLAQQYAAERENMQSAHQRELERVQTYAQQSLKDAEERASSRVRDVETRADLRVKAAEDQSAREVSAARDAATRDKTDLERMLLARITDEQRNHERELRAKDEAFASRAEVQKTAFEMRIAQKDDEIRRLGGDAERFRVEAEKNRDLPARMQEFAVAAEAMGFAKDGGAPEPASWKELAGQVGLQLVAKLPEIVQSAGEAVRGVKPLDMSQQAHMQQMQYEAQNTQARRMVPPLPTRSGQPFGQQPRMIFGTEDGPAFHGGDGSHLEGAGAYVQPRDPGAPINEPMIAPLGLQVQPMAGPPPSPMVNPGSPPQYVYPPQAPPQQQAQTWQMPPQQQAAPPVQQQPAAAPAQTPPAAGAEAVSPEQIMQIAPVVEQAFAAKEPPENLAAGIIAQVGKPMAAAITKALSVERVVATVQQHNPASALIRRDGQKYLRAVWAQVKAQSAE